MADADEEDNNPHLMTYFMVAIVGVLFLALLFHKSPTPTVHVHAAHENSFARALRMDKKAMQFTEVESDAETAGTRALRDTEAELGRGATDRQALESAVKESQKTRLTATNV